VCVGVPCDDADTRNLNNVCANSIASALNGASNANELILS
jgi:hypothetical protein